MNADIDWAWIEAREGKKLEVAGYVPLGGKRNYLGDAPPPTHWPSETNQSGVTIGYGFDLGQHSAAEIRALCSLADIAAECIKLLPFAAKKRLEACGALYDAKGLTLSKASAAALDAAVQRKKLQTFVKAFDRAASRKGKGTFEGIPGRIKTAIMSFAFQYGQNGHWKGATASKYWQAITGHEWSEARRILEQEYVTDLSTPRRHLEATLYRDAGVNLPKNPQPAPLP